MCCDDWCECSDVCYWRSANLEVTAPENDATEVQPSVDTSNVKRPKGNPLHVHFTTFGDHFTPLDNHFTPLDDHFTPLHDHFTPFYSILFSTEVYSHRRICGNGLTKVESWHVFVEEKRGGGWVKRWARRGARWYRVGSALVWRFLEVHVHKLVLLVIFVLCVHEVWSRLITLDHVWSLTISFDHVRSRFIMFGHVCSRHVWSRLITFDLFLSRMLFEVNWNWK